MPRIARIVVPGRAHHVTQRGNRRMQTFFCDDDYQLSHWLADRIAGWTCRWSEQLARPDEAELAAAMRQRENTGRPLGDENFVKLIGQLLSRDLLPKKRGPKGPRKKGKKPKNQ